ncbi:MAG: hypothetical protein PWQ22_655 [Archaeoglobaceae archaeon]|nr:hypothetical protein [Archaeoglobaceae archaeon]MDK2876245.1 hypothetical protein [Archaeoglobaceae archaeon]
MAPKGDNKYPGVTPALVIHNMIWRYTDPGDLVVDPMADAGQLTMFVKRRNADVFATK